MSAQSLNLFVFLWIQIRKFLQTLPQPALAAVIAQISTSPSYVSVFGPAELDGFRGDVAKFEKALRERIGELGLEM
jgi:hypothetical protein